MHYLHLSTLSWSLTFAKRETDAEQTEMGKRENARYGGEKKDMKEERILQRFATIHLRPEG